MAKTHVAEILIGGKNPNGLVMQRLKEKSIKLNKEKLKSSVGRTSYVTLEGDFFNEDSLNFTAIDQNFIQQAASTKHALVYCVDVRKDVTLEAQIVTANGMFETFSNGTGNENSFIVAITEKFVPNAEELNKISELQTKFSDKFVYKAQCQLDMAKLRKELLKFVQERVKEVDSDTPTRSPSSSSISSLETIASTEPVPLSVPELQEVPVPEKSQPSTIIPTTTANFSNNLETFISNFRAHYVDQNKNSTGINKMMQKINEISKKNDENKGDQIVAMMAEVSNERLTSVRSFWSNSRFFGKGRSKDANELYQMCAKKDVTFEDLVTLVNRNRVMLCQQDS